MRACEHGGVHFFSWITSLDFSGRNACAASGHELVSTTTRDVNRSLSITAWLPGNDQIAHMHRNRVALGHTDRAVCSPFHSTIAAQWTTVCKEYILGMIRRGDNCGQTQQRQQYGHRAAFLYRKLLILCPL